MSTLTCPRSARRNPPPRIAYTPKSSCASSEVQTNGRPIIYRIITSRISNKKNGIMSHDRMLPTHRFNRVIERAIVRIRSMLLLRPGVIEINLSRDFRIRGNRVGPLRPGRPVTFPATEEEEAGGNNMAGAHLSEPYNAVPVRRDALFSGEYRSSTEIPASATSRAARTQRVLTGMAPCIIESRDRRHQGRAAMLVSVSNDLDCHRRREDARRSWPLRAGCPISRQSPAAP